MSAAASQAALRSRLVAALRESIESEPSRALGARLGIDGTTVLRRGADLSAWSARDLLDLAASDSALAEALAAAALGQLVAGPQGSRLSVVADLLARSAAAGETVAAISGVLADGRVTADEARALLATLRARRGIDQQVEADLLAIIGD